MRKLLFETALSVVAWIIIITCMICFWGCTAHAWDSDILTIEKGYAPLYLEGAQKIAYLSALAFTDYRQTVGTVVKRPNRYQELNPILGKHPSRGSLLTFGIIGVAATALISCIDHPLARIAVDSIIATEQQNIWENEHRMRQRTSIPIMLVVSYKF